MWPDQLHLPHTDDLDPMPLQPSPWASSLHVGSHSPARCVLQKHRSCFSSSTELSSQEPLLGQISHPGASSQVPRLAFQVERGYHLGQRLASSV